MIILEGLILAAVGSLEVSLADDQTRRQLLASMLASGALGAGGDIPSSIDPDGEEPDSEAQPVPKQGPYTPLINTPRNQNNGYSPSQKYPPSAGNPLALALAGGGMGGAEYHDISGDAGDMAPSTPPGTHYAKLPGPPLLLAGGEAGVSEGGGASTPPDDPLAAIGKMLGMGSGASPAPPSAASPVAEAKPIAGQSSDLAPQNPEQQAIFKARQDLRAREADLTAQINGTWNPKLREALAAQRLQLATHDQQLENLYIGTLKEQSAEGDLTPEQAARVTASGGDPAKYHNVGGKPELIPQEADDTLELKELSSDPFGNKSFGVFNKRTGEIKPYTPSGAQTSSPADAAQVQQLEADKVEGDKTPAGPLPPEEQARLQQVNPAIKETVESILQGKMGLPKITSGRGAQLPLAITQAVMQVRPGFDANTNQNQLLARKAFNSGGSNNTPGQLILNSDAALDHFEPLVRASDALPNYGSVIGGAVGGTARATGGLVGGDYQNKASALVSAATPASAETMKYLAGTTGGGEGEREQLIQSFADTGGTPQSRRESVQNYIEDMLAKKQELQVQWHHAMDSPGGARAPDFPVISDSARAAVVRMGYGNLLEKYGLQGGEAASAAPAAAPQRPPAATTAPRRGVYIPGKGIQFQ